MRAPETELKADGRQSPTALAVARGVRRLLRSLGYSTLPEVALPSGRRADLVAVSGDSAIHIIEIKSCVADFRADQKWPDYRAHCDRLYFAIPQDMPQELLPPDATEWLAQVPYANGFKEPVSAPAVVAEDSTPSLLDDLGAWSDFYGQEIESYEDLKDYLTHLREEINEHLAEFNTVP